MSSTPFKQMRLRVGAAITTVLAAAVFVSTAPTVNADETPEPTPVVSPTPVDETTEPAEPTATPTTPPESTPEEATPEADEAATANSANTATITSATPLRAGQTVKVRAIFPGLKSAKVWGEVWFEDAKRWSATVSYTTNDAGMVEIPLSWNSGSVDTQRWRIAAQQNSGTVVYTNELEVQRRPLPTANTDSWVLQGQPANITGSFYTSEAIQVWGEVWTGRHWSKTAPLTTNSSGEYGFAAKWGAERRGVQIWRFATKRVDGTIEYTPEVKVVRRHPATVSRPGTLEVGQTFNTWGAFDAQGTPVTVWGEIWVGSHWSRTASVTSNASGDYRIALSYNSWYRGTQRWRIAGQFSDGSIQYTPEFSLTRHARPTVSTPRVLPANYPMSTFGKFPVGQSVKYWGEVWTGSYWSRTATNWTDSQGNYTLDLSYGGHSGGTLKWRVAGQMPDGVTVYSREFETVRTAPLDPRCKTGRVLCATKEGKRLWLVINGEITESLDARFGRPGLDTREGVHRILWKSRYHTSTIYHVYMPYALFFNGGQAIHYSEGFAQSGHIGEGSAGCINVRDEAAIARIFDAASVGDKVVVYR